MSIFARLIIINLLMMSGTPSKTIYCFRMIRLVFRFPKYKRDVFESINVFENLREMIYSINPFGVQLNIYVGFNVGIREADHH